MSRCTASAIGSHCPTDSGFGSGFHPRRSGSGSRDRFASGSGNHRQRSGCHRHYCIPRVPHSDRIARTIRRAKQQMRRLPRVGLPCWMLEWWMLAEWVMFNGPRTKFDWAQATVCGHTLKRQQSQTGEIIQCIADKATSADWIFMPARQSKRCKFGQSILFYSPSVGKNFPLMLPAACGQLISLFRNLVPEITEYYTKVYLWEHLYSVGKKI